MSLAAFYECRARKKNVPWHITAPAAVACDIYLIRRSAHPRGAFFTLQESNFLKSKKRALLRSFQTTKTLFLLFLHSFPVFYFNYFPANTFSTTSGSCDKFSISGTSSSIVPNPYAAWIKATPAFLLDS